MLQISRKMQFSNPKIAELFDIVGEQNPEVVVGKYKGPLADIPKPEMVAGMVARKSNLVVAKQPTAKKAEAPNPKGEDNPKK